jgi:hypothetical protein
VSLSKTRSFPLSVVKQPKVEVAEQKTIKDCLLEIARIVHGSLQSKEVLAKQIKQDCGISRKSIDQFMKDVVQRKKMEGDTKVRQIIDPVKFQEPPYSCDQAVLDELNEILMERIISQ